MATRKDDDEDVMAGPPPGMVPVGDLAGILEKLVTLVEDGPIKQVPAAKAKVCTPWNPTGRKDRPKLTRKVYENGHPLSEGRLTEEEITLLNQLKPGRYNGRRWTVIETDGEGDRTMDIHLPNKTESDRIELARYGTLANILRLMVEEAKKPVVA